MVENYQYHGKSAQGVNVFDASGSRHGELVLPQKYVFSAEKQNNPETLLYLYTPD